MSILDRIKEKQKESAGGAFVVVAGPRLSGKSTAAGTLPGKTLMLQADVLETGSSSAAQLAKRLKNKLDIISFTSLGDLSTLLSDEDGLKGYDNIYIDGLSAVNEMKYESQEVQKIIKKNVWDGYRELGDSLKRFLLLAKGLSASKNVLMTMALDVKYDTNGMACEAKPAMKGNVTTNEVTRLCPVVLSITTEYDEEGELHRKFLTKGDGVLPGRIDSILDEDNPGELPADLSKVFDLLNGGNK
jgi:hypothetical protein